jgi:hypothetical protein
VDDLEDDIMNMLSMTMSRSMEAVPGALDIAFPDVGDLMPFVTACLVSVLCTALWLLAVSSYVSKRRVPATR